MIRIANHNVDSEELEATFLFYVSLLPLEDVLEEFKGINQQMKAESLGWGINLSSDPEHDGR